MYRKKNTQPAPGKPNNQLKEGKYALDNYAFYSGIAIQMLVAIGGGAWLGVWLDEKYGTGRTWTLTLSLLGVFYSLYQIYKIARHSMHTNNQNDKNSRPS